MDKQLTLRAGFSLIEMMASIVILGIISVATISTLRVSQQKDELNNAVRIVAGDLRSLQSRALSTDNVKSCVSGGKQIVCETNASACGASPCVPIPPAGFGMAVVAGTSAYDLFAEVEPTTLDWKKTNANEVFLTRDFAKSGGTNVVISSLTGGYPSTNVSFQRQNGSMVIDGCDVSAGCAVTTTMNIVLRHTALGDTKTIQLNAYTGRISVQ